jgi:putative endonuclease
MAKFYYIYVLRSKIDNNFYVGYTENLKSRFEQHSKGSVISTKNRGQLELIYSEACLSKRDATHREKYLKTYHGKLFIRNRLKSYLTG